MLLSLGGLDLFGTLSFERCFERCLPYGTQRGKQWKLHLGILVLSIGGMVGTSWKGKKQQAGVGKTMGGGWWNGSAHIRIEKFAFTPNGLCGKMWQCLTVIIPTGDSLPLSFTALLWRWVLFCFFQMWHPKNGHHNLVSFREFVERQCMVWTCFTVFCDFSHLLRALYLVLFSLKLFFAHICVICLCTRTHIVTTDFWFESCISTSPRQPLLHSSGFCFFG